ncbi:1,4-dihydroxy-2-naphthoate octaprenyltransferase [Hahella chejuensis KCTC 2396]|uniref:1,4-dihydroxy-2-naphthoate octaprenyltransferase n=1 Tax=Hahella chejuensis (strain KCTC 2396) TaxID=349521 RepID=Q2SBT7_HAHCH|nr:prenyltransferase [Hahella chejuensis]ABC31887.1 1,4-dihydroxy-2-naphthoate octaprenyltransferase [Hahella chejuensis KCTC 2396]
MTAAAPQTTNKYRFASALRPFSLIIAIACCSIAFAPTVPDADFSALLATLTFIATLLAQCGVNLINDWSDQSQPELRLSPDQIHAIRRNFALGMACFAIAAILGSVIMSIRGPVIALLAMAGFAGCLAYTIEPFNLKRRGLGLILVFVLMGPLLITGAGFSATGNWSQTLLLDSIAFGPLISLVLMANEIRDIEKDLRHGDRTLSSILGLPRAKAAFLALLGLTAFGYIALIALDRLSSPVWMSGSCIFALFLARQLLQMHSITSRHNLPQLAGRLTGVTALCHVLSI